MQTLLQQQVWQRAKSSCEYCQMPQVYDRNRFPVDHIIGRQHGGPTTLENLALACFPCNSHKGPNIGGLDPMSGALVPLFHPRRDRWSEHFVWDGPILMGLTPTGSATIQVLAINDPDYVAVRRSLLLECVFPPNP